MESVTLLVFHVITPPCFRQWHSSLARYLFHTNHNSTILSDEGAKKYNARNFSLVIFLSTCHAGVCSYSLTEIISRCTGIIYEFISIEMK